MRITEIDLQCEDIMWFGIDSHNHIFGCTSAGCGNVPEFVCKSKQNTDDIQNIVNGNIEIINIGDSQSWNIIVNGEEKGNMWYFTDVGIQPCKPSMIFLEWFEFWLDGKEDYFYEIEI